MSKRKTMSALSAWLAGTLIVACADQRLDRSDDEAMMVYRECMSGPPSMANSSDMSMTISNTTSTDPTTSIAAKTQTRQDEAQHMRCAQLAGWKD